MSKIAIVTGASSGLGECIARKLATDHDFVVVDWSLETGVNVANEQEVMGHAKIFAERYGSLDVLVNCAGINGLNYIEDLSGFEFDRIMSTNAKSILFTAAHLWPCMTVEKGVICNIISNASHVPMTASLAYNASKGAAAIMTRQMAREMGPRHGITVFGISPNKLEGTGMSLLIEAEVPHVRGWSREEAERRQNAALLLGEPTPPEAVAEFAAWLLAKPERNRYLAGSILDYGV